MAKRWCPSTFGVSLHHPVQGWYRLVKVPLEFSLALILFLLTIPFILVGVLLVKLTSRGPAFYSQLRLGKNGRPFKVHKIRTMVHNCEKMTGPAWSSGLNDPRIIRIGRFLRRTHLDELPQLWNVLCGEMGLVGPRPERPEIIASLEKSLPHYRDRLVILPGITGLAQVQLPADTDLASVRRKLVYDLYYISQMSLWFDLRLMLCTGVRMVGVPFHLITHFFLLPKGDIVERHFQDHAGQSVLVLQPTPEPVAVSTSQASRSGPEIVNTLQVL